MPGILTYFSKFFHVDNQSRNQYKAYICIDKKVENALYAGKTTQKKFLQIKSSSFIDDIKRPDKNNIFSPKRIV